MTGSDPDKSLFSKDNRYILGCFFLLAAAFRGQKQGFKIALESIPYCPYSGQRMDILFF